ncbi:hypothetical protein Pint_08993 [Pistacia integerrima]|uniref:Uncharacterized protein n=1 Tax=Pistacia integerrima TaxID=434235 RepID=A0ACC0XWP6_9ROSI|nr:hypothetical protein Pint_08993 [Pistacia integerrima]
MLQLSDALGFGLASSSAPAMPPSSTTTDQSSDSIPSDSTGLPQSLSTSTHSSSIEDSQSSPLTPTDFVPPCSATPPTTIHCVSLLCSAFAYRDLGSLGFFLGMEVVRDNIVLYLSQRRYVMDLLRHFQLDSCAPCATPFSSSKASQSSDDDHFPNMTLYRSVVGGLQYLTLTRSDIAFVINQVAQRQSAPTQRDMCSVKRIFRYCALGSVPESDCSNQGPPSLYQQMTEMANGRVQDQEFQEGASLPAQPRELLMHDEQFRVSLTRPIEPMSINCARSAWISKHFPLLSRSQLVGGVMKRKDETIISMVGGGRLPVKSLARFKCIDRSWSSLISDPDFVYAHLKRAKTENHCGLLLSFISHDNLSTTINLFTINDYALAVLDYSVQVCLDSYCILPSCNGLVCFYGVRGGIHICNPATKNMVKLPGNGAKGSRLLSCGFGFDRQACTSKVIMISEPSSSADDPNIEIFTMGTRSWRTVKYHERFRFLNRQPPVFASGFFYWIIANNDSSGFLIASFDIGSETFEVIHPPESVSRKDWHMLCLGELGGDLCLMDIDFELEGRRRMDLWLLKEVSGKSSGHEKKQRWIQDSIVHPSEPLDATRPVALNHERSEILLHGFLKGSDSLMNWYNLETRSFREQDMKEISSPYFHVSTHVESFVPLNV